MDVQRLARVPLRLWRLGHLQPAPDLAPHGRLSSSLPGRHADLQPTDGARVIPSRRARALHAASYSSHAADAAAAADATLCAAAAADATRISCCAAAAADTLCVSCCAARCRRLRRRPDLCRCRMDMR